MDIESDSTPGRGGRSAGNVLLAVAFLGLLVAVGGYVAWKASAPIPGASTSGSTAETGDSSGKTGVTSQGPRLPVPTASQPTAEPAERLSKASAVDAKGLIEAEALLADLERAGEEAGPISPARAKEIDGYFRSLSALGEAAVPAMAALLRSGRDASFVDARGRTPATYPTLRAGLIETLGRNATPEAIALLSETLETAIAPAEVAALARALERRAPGVYREQLLEAARGSVAAAAEALQSGVPTSPDAAVRVGALFDTMGDLGDINLLTETLREQQDVPAWKTYSMLALAQSGEAEGVRALRDLLDPVEGAVAEEDWFALQMLGQAASRSTEAGEALLEVAIARGREIPAREWKQLAAVMRGYSYDFPQGTPPALSAAAGQDMGMDVDLYGSQVKLRQKTTDPSRWPANRAQRQLALIDQLLATGPPAEAAEALQQAREWIVSRTGQAVPLSRDDID
jgi:hypothetical protein